MPKTGFKIGKYGFEIDTDEKAIKFYDLGARGVITEVDSLYENTIFWLASIGYCIEDLAQDTGSLARLTSENFPDLGAKSRLNTYTEYAFMYGRHVDYQNWYGVYLYYNYSTSDHRVAKCINGTISTLGSEGVDLPSGVWYWVLFEIVGTELRSYRATDPTVDVPDTPQITVTDTDIATGRWGVRHWGLGLRGLQGLYLVFKQPSSPARKPIAYFEIPIDGEGKPETPIMPKLPVDIVEVEKVTVYDKRKYELLANTLKKYGIPEEVINALAEAMDIATFKEKVNKLSCTWSMLLPTPKGQPADSVAVVRVFDVVSDRVIDAIRDMGGVRISRDEAIKKALKLDDKLHEIDLVQITDPDEAKKKAKEYVEWREKQFKVKMKLEDAVRYAMRYKGW